MIHELIDRELYEALEYARSIDQETGKRILIQFEVDQPVFSQTLFNVFPAIIAQQSDAEQYDALAQFFADLSFDVLSVYLKAFGKMPTAEEDPGWMERQALSLDKELAPLLVAQVNQKTAKKMREDFFKPKQGEFIQTGLVNFLNDSIDDFASEHAHAYESDAMLELVKTMLFVVVRLFNNLYAVR
jgi:hypothetical protein